MLKYHLCSIKEVLLMIVLDILIALVAVVLIVSVLMQDNESDGMGALTGSSETFFGKNKTSTLEGKLAMITKIAAGVFVALALLILILG